MRGSPVVLIDATPVTAGSTGVARYTRELIRCLPAAGADIRPFAIGRGRNPAPPGTTMIRAPQRVAQAWWRCSPLPRIEHLIGRGDLAHSTGLVPPPTRLPLIMTIHDVLAVTRPDLHSKAAARRQRRHLAELDRATAILSVSQTTADDLVRLGFAATRIEVTRMGCTPLASPSPIPGLPSRFVLAVGELHPRKGLEVLIRSLAHAPEVRAVFAGPDAGIGQVLRRLAMELGVEGRVQFLGQVTDAQLAWLYGEASVLAFPSRAEGFGLPLLEALAAGLPVVATDLPVFREVAGDAARFVPIGDAVALGGALCELMEDETARGQMSRAGLERAQAFTWDATAASTVACYRKMVG